MGLSLWHILVVVLVIFVLFGAGRVPRIMEDLAKGIKSFKHGLKDEDASTTAIKSITSEKDKENV